MMEGGRHDFQLVRLADGRRVGYAEYGDPRGRPVIYCHGFPASRLEARLVHETAAELGLRLLALDRPGYGRSDDLPGRSLSDWADDVAQFCRILGITRTGLLGISGGGPYALTCAAALPPGLASSCTLVCPLGPLAEDHLLAAMHWPGRFSFGLARRMPRLAEWLFGGPIGALLRRHPARALRLLTVSAPAADRGILSDPAVFSLFSSAIEEALVQGGRGPGRDLVLYARPWGIDLAEIKLPVTLWQGDADETVPAAMGRYLAGQLPQCQLRMMAGEGHFSLPIRHARAILETLAAS